MVHLVSFTNISDEFWPLTYFSRSDRPAQLVCLSIQFLLAYIYDGDQSITAYLPQNYLNQTSHQYQNCTFAAFCQYLGWVWSAVTLVDRWPTFHGQIGHCKTYYNNIIWIKHHIHAKREHLVNLANILYTF